MALIRGSIRVDLGRGRQPKAVAVIKVLVRESNEILGEAESLCVADDMNALQFQSRCI